MTPQTPPNEDLVARLDAGERSNALDVLIEIATFKPDEVVASIRANRAGTKVICTAPDGRETTHWAADWSLRPGTARSALTGSAQG